MWPFSGRIKLPIPATINRILACSEGWNQRDARNLEIEQGSPRVSPAGRLRRNFASHNDQRRARGTRRETGFVLRVRRFPHEWRTVWRRRLVGHAPSRLLKNAA